MYKIAVMLGAVISLTTTGAAGAGLDLESPVGLGMTAADNGQASDAVLRGVLGAAGLDASLLGGPDDEPRFHPWDAAQLAEHWDRECPRGHGFSYAVLIGLAGAPDARAEPDRLDPAADAEPSNDWSYRAVSWRTDPLASVKPAAAPARDSETLASPSLLDAGGGNWLKSDAPRGVVGELHEAPARDLWRPARPRADAADYDRVPQAGREIRAVAAPRAAAVLLNGK